MKNFAISVLYLSFAALIIAAAARLFYLPTRTEAEVPQISEEEIRRELYDSIRAEIYESAYAEGEARAKIAGYKIGFSDGYDKRDRMGESSTDWESTMLKYGITYNPKGFSDVTVYVLPSEHEYHAEKCELLTDSKIEVPMDVAKALDYIMCHYCFY